MNYVRLSGGEIHKVVFLKLSWQDQGAPACTSIVYTLLYMQGSRPTDADSGADSEKLDGHASALSWRLFSFTTTFFLTGHGVAIYSYR